MTGLDPTNARTLARARRLLVRPSAWLEGREGLYLLRLTSGRQGQVLLTLNEAAFLALAADPGLRTRPAGGWKARERAHQTPDRAGRPGVVEGEQMLMQADGTTVLHRANLAHSPVVWLARHKGPDGRPWLTPAQVAAAERLEADAEMALRGPSLTMRWDALPRARGGSAARVEPGDAAMAAARRVEAALLACGPARTMIDHICIRTSTLQVAEQALGLKRRTGKQLLIAGLDALARHYRIG